MASILPWRTTCLRFTPLRTPTSFLRRHLSAIPPSARRPILPTLNTSFTNQRRHNRFNRSDIFLYDAGLEPTYSKINQPKAWDNLPTNPTEEEIYGVAKPSFYPEQTSKSVAYWLFGTAGLVFGIVVLGGLTRLTESGLSITEWKPVTGILPPTTPAQWEIEFSKYRSSPEFQILNPTMSLHEYKFIYYMEWAHRILGRVIGVSFILPAAYFVLTKRVSKPMSLGLLGVAAGIGFQGFIGWWMVKSGLTDDLFKEKNSVPRVSQYRLTTHLGAAFAVYSAMMYSGLLILKSHAPITTEVLTQKHLTSLAKTRPVALGLTALVFITALSGGLVAGLDAGLIYNEFPYMGNGLAPPKSELLDPFYSHEPTPHNDLIWRNMLENPSTVQLQHRILATTLFISVLGFWVLTRRIGPLPKPVLKAATGLVGIVSFQVALGITTLLYLVPTPIAAAHQANSLLLLTWCLVLMARVRKGGVGALRGLAGKEKVVVLKPYWGRNSLQNV